MNQLALDLQPVQEVYRIPLTQGQFALVDKEDFEELSKRKWSAKWSKNTKSYYAARSQWAVDTKKNHTIQMHRQILGHPSGMVVDHRNGDTLDNRRINLRVATHSQNSRNQKKKSGNQSGYKGVGWSKSRQYWEVRLRIKGKYVHMVGFSSKEKAYEAYKKAAVQLHGDFANFG